jgi:hypothetical protein
LFLRNQKPGKTIYLFDKKEEINVPRALSGMSDEIWTLKYHNLSRPQLVLTDENGEINLLADLTQQAATESQIGSYKDFPISNLKNTRTDIKIIRDGIKNVRGKEIGFIKFSSGAIDQSIYNYFFLQL